MTYVGNPIDTLNTFQSLQGKRFSGDGSTTAFTLDVAPSSTLDIEVFVGNVRQDPNSAYTLSGTTLTFTGAPPSGTNNIYVVHQAKSVGTIDVPDDIISGKTLVTLDNSADHVLIEDATDGELKKALIPAASFAGIDDQSSSNDDQLTITDTAVVINEDSDDVDFRVESNGNANMLFVSGGNDVVGIGAEGDLGVGLHIKTADSGASADSNADELIVENGTSSGDSGINILSATNGTGRVSFGDSGDNDVGFMRYDHSNGRMWFINNGGDTTYAHAFDSNVTTTTKFRLQIFSDGAENQRHRMIGFDNSSQGRGYIESGDGDSTAPQFAAGSDRRLKENITSYTGGYDKIKAIPVKQWDEKYSSKNKGVKGWVADELETVFPDAVSGTANSTKNVTNAILDKDGRLVEENTTEARLKTMQSIGKMPNCTFVSSATVPVYQYSSPLRFFPDVVQALQKSIEKIETLETEITALKARVTTLEG